MKPSLGKTKKTVIFAILPIPLILLVGLAGWGGWKWHEQPQMCAVCHEMQPYVDSWESSDFNVQKHAEKGVRCIDCHEADISTLVKDGVGHLQGKFEQRTETLYVDNEFCFTCHTGDSKHTDWDAVIALTAGRESELVVNPHDLYHGTFDCSECHTMHNAEPSNICIECHKPGVPLDELPDF